MVDDTIAPPVPKALKLGKKRVDKVEIKSRTPKFVKELKAEAEVTLEDTYTPKKAQVVELEALKYADGDLADTARKKKIIWQPFPGVQTDFLSSDEDEVLFAGGRGSGKSTCLIVDPLRYCHNKNFRALVIRRTMPELKELIRSAKELYYQAFPGVKWREQDKMFVFPSGATIDFGYCDAVDDAERYRGQQYTWLGIDELTQYDSPEIYTKLKGSLRTTDPTLKIYIRATSNPTGRGRWWVKEYFIDNAVSGKPFIIEFDTPVGKLRISRKWFQSTVMDNPALLKNNPQYLATLASLPDILRKQWLEGSWDAVEGMAFTNFDAATHVIEPFTIPKGWLKFRGCDWGFGSLAVVVWLAADTDNNLYVYKEFVCNGNTKDEYGIPKPRLEAPEFAREVLRREKDDNVRYGVLDSSTWANRGDSGPSIAEEMIMSGCTWRPSDRSPGSRKAGLVKFHQLLKKDEFTKKPKIFIFSSCKELIKCIQSLPIDENDPEDVDTDANDHAWDALRYAIMSRPHIANADDWALNKDPKPIIIDPVFGL